MAPYRVGWSISSLLGLQACYWCALPGMTQGKVEQKGCSCAPDSPSTGLPRLEGGCEGLQQPCSLHSQSLECIAPTLLSEQ